MTQLTLTEYEWLQTSLTRGLASPHFQIVTITPALAADMLQRNTENRPISKAHKDAIASSIRSGDWKLTHQGVAFDKGGRLIDGQHRLEGVVETNTPVQMAVSFGWDTGNFAVIDSARKRSGRDVLEISGMDNAALRAAISRIYARMNQPLKKGTPPITAVLKAAEEMAGDDLDWSIRVGNTIYYSFKKLRPSTLCLALWLIRKNTTHLHRLDAFCEGLKTGADLPAGSPILKLRNHNGGRYQDYAQVGDIIQVWNAWVDGKRVGKLGWDAYVPPKVI